MGHRTGGRYVGVYHIPVRPAQSRFRRLRRMPFVVAALLAVLGASRLELLGRINESSPGGRYEDPLAPAALSEAVPQAQSQRASGLPPAYLLTPGLEALGTNDWVPTSRAGWSYRALLERLGAAAESPRIGLHTFGEVRYGREAYPLVALTVSAAASGPARVRVLLSGAVHGNETAGSEALVRFAELLARSPGLYREVAFDIIPVVNPWGWVNYSRANGAGKDINRDFASSQTQEAAALRAFVAARIRAKGAYEIALDHHESTKQGYFVYQYTTRRAGLGSEFARVVELAGKPLETEYREAGFPVRRGVLSIPAITLPYVSLLGRLSLEQYLRLRGTRHAYTLESPLSDIPSDRVRIHGESIRAMLNAYLRGAGAPVEGSIKRAAAPAK